MRTGASARPTDARKSAVRAATCAGVPMLRLNRMKPQGSASRKKARSSGVSSGPEQPTMKAVVIVRAYDRAAARSRIVPRRLALGIASVLRHEALSAGGLQPRAERRRFVARHRSDADAVDRAAVDLGATDRGRLAGEFARMALLQLLEGHLGLLL